MAGLYLQGLLGRGRPCCQQQGGVLGRTHWAGQGVRTHSPEELGEVGRSRSSFQVKDSRRRRRRSGLEQHEKLEQRRGLFY